MSLSDMLDRAKKRRILSDIVEEAKQVSYTPTFAAIEAIAEREGMSVVYAIEKKKDGRERILKDAAVAVNRFIRGIGTENVATYRTTSSGYDKHHIRLRHEDGYIITRLHSSEWKFKGGHPAEDPGRPWARLGEYEYTPQGVRVPHTDFYEVQEEKRRKGAQEMAARLKAAEAKTMLPAPRRKSRASSTKMPPPTAPRSFAEDLIRDLDSLTSVSVLEGGAKRIGDNVFKVHKEELRRAYIDRGGTSASFDEALYRNDLEVIEEKSAYRGHRNPILTVVIHSSLKR